MNKMSKKMLLFCACIFFYIQKHFYLKTDSTSPVSQSSYMVEQQKEHVEETVNGTPYYTSGKYHPAVIRALKPKIWRDPNVMTAGNELEQALKLSIPQTQVVTYKNRLVEEQRNYSDSVMSDPVVTELKKKLNLQSVQIQADRDVQKAQAALSDAINAASKKVNLEKLKTDFQNLKQQYDTSKVIAAAEANLKLVQETAKKQNRIDLQEQALKDQQQVVKNRYLNIQYDVLMEKINHAYNFGYYNPSIVTKEVMEGVKTPSNKKAFDAIYAGMVNFPGNENMKSAYDSFAKTQAKMSNALYIDPTINLIKYNMNDALTTAYNSNPAVVSAQNKLYEAMTATEAQLGLRKAYNLYLDAQNQVNNSLEVVKARKNFEYIKSQREKSFGITDLKTNISTREKQINDDYYIPYRKEELSENVGRSVSALQTKFDAAVDAALEKEKNGLLF